jgi:hypothetical protein
MQPDTACSMAAVIPTWGGAGKPDAPIDPGRPYLFLKRFLLFCLTGHSTNARGKPAT